MKAGTNAADTGGASGRRERIRRRVLDEGYARIDDLTGEFGVSLMTIHRDLDALQAEGWLIKNRGGVTANPSALVEAGVGERSSAMAAEKQALAREAATLLSRGQTVFLDDSTTVLSLAPFVREHAPITVATNFVPVLDALGDADGVDLFVLGGQYHRHQQSCAGSLTAEAIARFQADLFFMSTTAILDGRLLHRSEATVLARRAFMAHAATSVLLVDHAKFGRSAPHVLCDVADFDIVVTDSGIEATDLELLRERCADVRVAPA